MANRIKVGSVIPRNSSYTYSLYAYFNSAGYFIEFGFGDFFFDKIDDLDLTKNSVFANFTQLRKFEHLKRLEV